MRKAKSWWLKDEKIPLIKKWLSHLSWTIRKGQVKLFWEEIKPSKKSKVLDVGVSSREELKDTNFFEKVYPYQENLTVASIEDCRFLKKKYPKIKIKRISSGKAFPFGNKTFDIVVSWATIEHVGLRKQQQFFLEELLRVGKKIFVTTPDKHAPYEPHTGFFFVHWLPHRYFGFICRILGREFWSLRRNLNPLTRGELERFLTRQKGIRILRYKMLGFIPSHLIIIKNT